jgi:WD40 repeat protein
LIVGLETNGLRIFDRSSFQELRRISTEYPASSPLRFSPDGQRLAGGRGTNLFELRNLSRDWAVESIWKVSGSPSDFVFSTDGRYLAVACMDNKSVALFDLRAEHSAPAIHLPNHMPPPLAWTPVWIPKTHMLAIGSGEPVIELWDVDTGVIRTVKLGAGNTWALAVTPDSRTLAVGTQDGFLQLINIRTLRLMATLRGHLTNIQRMSFSPDGTMLLSYGGEGTRLWSAREILTKSY